MLDKKAVSYHIPAALMQMADSVGLYQADADMFFLAKDELAPELVGRQLPYEEVRGYYEQMFVFDSEASRVLTSLCSENLRRMLEERAGTRTVSIRVLDQGGHPHWLEIVTEPVSSNEVLITAKSLRRVERDTAVVAAVNPKYDYVAKVDVATSTYAIFVRDEGDGLIPEINGDYETSIRDFNAASVVPEESERLTRAMHLERVLSVLEHEDDYCLYCTMIEGGERRRKRIRYCWLDAMHEKLLISRVDITDIVNAQRLRAEEESLGAAYLDNLPIACCVLRVAYDEAERPVDAFYVYSNREHAHLNVVEHGAMVGKRQRDHFMGEEDTFFTAVFDTAATGRGHLIERFSPSLQKHLLVSTFQPEPGCCGCAIIDMTEQRRLERDLARSRQKLDFILSQTMDVVFQYDPASGRLDLFSEGSHIEGVPQFFKSFQDLMQLGVVLPDQHGAYESLVGPIRSEALKSSGEIQLSLPAGSSSRWYRVALYAHSDDVDGHRYILGYLTDIEDFVRRRMVLEREARLDPLTGVLNARAGRETASRRVERLDGTYTGLLAIFDLDEFKSVNDVYGHQVGDRVLQEFSKVLVTAFRSEDTVYRLGGDEFAVYMESCRDPRRVAESVMARFYCVLGEHEVDGISIKASAGIFASPRPHDFGEFYSRADACLYKSKSFGRGRWNLDVEEREQP